VKALETRVPPLVIVASIAAAMWGVRYCVPGLTAFFPGRLALAFIVLAVGLTVIVAGVLEFRRARTTVDPTHPEKATAVVDSGIYRFTRNPMYLGMLLTLIAWAVFLANPLTLAGPVLFVLAMNCWQIGPEERALTQLFGDPYGVYFRRVRRWI
jgi:protein-S-isoprenylcysteine O-methyltransferase Ste14